MSTQINYTSVDINEIKADLIAYLKTQGNFSDYNFSGSNLDTLVSMLAHVTNISAYNLNQGLQEVYLSTANLRGNVLRVIKQLNYTPYRANSAKVAVDLTNIKTAALPSNPTAKTSYLLQYDKIFSGAYQFVYLGNNIELVNYDSFAQSYSLSDVQFSEGELIGATEADKIEFLGTDTDYQSYLIPDTNVGDYLRVVTYDDSGYNPLAIPSQRGQIVLKDWSVYEPGTVYADPQNAMIYFVEETEDGYKISFGNNKLGRHVATTEKIRIIYMAPSGEVANGLLSFKWLGGGSDMLPATIYPPFNQKIINTTTVALNAANQFSIGGTAKETIEEIKFNAPKFASTQGRAVTEDDYTSIALKHPLIGLAYTTGGQKVINDAGVAQLGKVFITTKPDPQTYPLIEFSDEELALLKDYFLKYSIVTITPVVTNPQYIYLKIWSKLRYIQDREPSIAAGKATIYDYITQTQGNLGEFFEFTKLTDKIDSSDVLIASNITKIEKYIVMKNDRLLSPNCYEIIDTFTGSRTGRYVIKLAKNLRQWKIDLNEKIPLGYPGDNGYGTVPNPFYKKEVPAMRIEVYHFNTLVDVIYPVDHPIHAGDIGYPNTGANAFKSIYKRNNLSTLLPYTTAELLASGLTQAEIDQNYTPEGGYGDTEVDIGAAYGDSDLDFPSPLSAYDEVQIVSTVNGDHGTDVTPNYTAPDIWFVAGSYVESQTVDTTITDALVDVPSNPDTARMYYGATKSAYVDGFYNQLQSFDDIHARYTLDPTKKPLYVVFTGGKETNHMYKVIEHGWQATNIDHALPLQTGEIPVPNYYLKLQAIHIQDGTVKAFNSFTNILRNDTFDIRLAARDLNLDINDAFGNPIIGSKLDAGEQVQVSGIHTDFAGYYQLLDTNPLYRPYSNYYRVGDPNWNTALSNNSEWFYTRRAIKVITTNGNTVVYNPTGYGKEMPIVALYSNLLFPGKLGTEPAMTYKLFFETNDNDLFLNPTQLLTSREADIFVTTEKV